MPSLTVQSIQRTLSATPRRYYRGAIDGVWGPLTQAACDDFHTFLGHKPPPWLIVAARELGISEVPGHNHNPRILRYHEHTSLKANADEIPWCSSFVNFCVDESSFPKTNSAAARSWLDYGKKLDKPHYGCVAVFQRGRPNAWTGHVGFVVWWNDDQTEVAILGGNQSNRVCVNIESTSKLLGYRYPVVY